MLCSETARLLTIIRSKTGEKIAPKRFFSVKKWEQRVDNDKKARDYDNFPL
jgi:hypothetical protein